jgi:putative acetyltransferase
LGILPVGPAGVSQAESKFQMGIKIDNLQGPKIAALLEEHLRWMRSVSPPESTHALDLDELCNPDITFWCVWDGQNLAGCGALRELDITHGEIKSMRTAHAYLRKGVAAKLVQHIVVEAKHRGYHRLSVETGSMAYFEPARQLYSKFGFKPCPPFADYVEDPNSVFMSTQLSC